MERITQKTSGISQELVLMQPHEQAMQMNINLCAGRSMYFYFVIIHMYVYIKKKKITQIQRC